MPDNIVTIEKRLLLIMRGLDQRRRSVGLGLARRKVGHIHVAWQAVPDFLVFLMKLYFYKPTNIRP